MSETTVWLWTDLIRIFLRSWKVANEKRVGISGLSSRQSLENGLTLEVHFECPIFVGAAGSSSNFGQFGQTTAQPGGKNIPREKM